MRPGLLARDSFGADRRRLWVVLCLMVLLLAACGSGEMSHPSSGGKQEAGEQFGFGHPGGDIRPDTEVLVRADDSLRFRPARLTVEKGETVKFVIRNEGEGEHEFMLGDSDTQEDHERMVLEGGSMEELSHAGNAVRVAPGKEEIISWTFTERGTVLYGCHEPGHYGGGMLGSVTVT